MILVLQERIRIHELQIQALGEALKFANPAFYNQYAAAANLFIENDLTLKQIRVELGVE